MSLTVNVMRRLFSSVLYSLSAKLSDFANGFIVYTVPGKIGVAESRKVLRFLETLDKFDLK
jgi:hypothetical protein